MLSRQRERQFRLNRNNGDMFVGALVLAVAVPAAVAAAVVLAVGTWLAMFPIFSLLQLQNVLTDNNFPVLHNKLHKILS
jgi:hypothetical protein